MGSPITNEQNPDLTLIPGKSPIELERLQQVRRRAAARVSQGDDSFTLHFSKRPVTPPSQRPSRKNRSSERSRSAPPDKLESVGVLQISDQEMSPFMQVHRRSLATQQTDLPNGGDMMF